MAVSYTHLEEGITFRLLTNPVEILGDENGFVTGIRCDTMALGEPDESGRRRPEVEMCIRDRCKGSWQPHG